MTSRTPYPVVPFEVRLYQDEKPVCGAFPFPELPIPGLQFSGSTPDGVEVRWVVKTVMVALSPEDTGRAWLSGDLSRTALSGPVRVHCEVDLAARYDGSRERWETPEA